MFVLTVAATCVGAHWLYNSTKESQELQGRVDVVESAKEFDAYLLVRKNTVILAEQAVEMFDRGDPGHFDAILMDMRMPVMDGLTATQEIRKLSRQDARMIPIVALTANAFEEDVQQCLKAGMDAHLSKPVDIDLLKETVGRLL